MAEAQETKSNALFTPVLIAGSLVLLIGFSVRASFGVFQIPIADEFGWLRADFSLAIAIQNLAWGIGQPIFGAIAEKLGDRRAIFLGVLTYSLGLLLSAYSTLPITHQVFAVLVGFGIAGTGFGVILAIVGRAASDENRSLALGVTTAIGSVGQIIGPIFGQSLLAYMNWSNVFIVFAAVILLAILLLPFITAPDAKPKEELEDTLVEILKKAFYDPSFTLIFVGFFSCGFQLAFVTAHFPAMITEKCSAILPDSLLANLGVSSTAALGALAISIVGAANVFGTITAGYLGRKYSKKNLLALIYTGRTIIAILFIIFPVTPLSVVLFSLAMGSLWLATVPLTSGLVGYIYGLKYMGTLYGIVFFSHQLGSFVGVWLGGALYDIYGTYDVVWWVGIGVGAFSAIVHIPVKEIPLKVREV